MAERERRQFQSEQATLHGYSMLLDEELRAARIPIPAAP